MSLATWFRLPKFRFASSVKPTTRRQPSRSRLLVEQLEDRLLLTGGVNSVPTLNSPAATFNTQQIGLTPANTTALQSNPLAITQLVNGTGSTLLNGVPIGAQANLLAQGQVSSQFFSFGVNSQGQGNGIQGFQMLTLNTALGFGSGVMPNAPWMPAAYNLGLANHQFNSASQSDMGFQSAPPWTHQFSYPAEGRQDPDTELTSWLPDSLLRQLSAKDQEQEPQDGSDVKAIWSEDTVVPAANVELKKQTATEETAAELKRGDPAIEAALFHEPWHAAVMASSIKSLEQTPWWNPNAKDTLNSSEDQADPAVDGPTEMAALVSGLPGAAMLVEASAADSGSAAE